MVKQYIYVDSAAALLNELVLFQGNHIKLNINGLLSDLPPYALISVKQLQFVSPNDFANGLILKITNGVSNQMNLNRRDSVLGICPFEYTKGTNYHFQEANISFPVMIAGNIQQIEIYFADCLGSEIALAGVTFCLVLEVETPDVGEPVKEYRKAMPL